MNWPKISVSPAMPSSRRSATKSSPYEKQLRELTFFLDRNLGSRRVADALREAGAHVEVHADHFSPDGADEEWLAACGASGWIAITLDYRIRYRASERDALKENKVKAFLVARAGEMSGETLGRLLVEKLPKLVALATQTSAPFAFRLTPSGAITKLPLKRL
jgi:hypothetical protein